MKTAPEELAAATDGEETFALLSREALSRPAGSRRCSLRIPVSPGAMPRWPTSPAPSRGRGGPSLHGDRTRRPALRHPRVRRQGGHDQYQWRSDDLRRSHRVCQGGGEDPARDRESGCGHCAEPWRPGKRQGRALYRGRGRAPGQARAGHRRGDQRPQIGHREGATIKKTAHRQGFTLDSSGTKPPGRALRLQRLPRIPVATSPAPATREARSAGTSWR